MVNKLLCMVHIFVNLTDDVSVSPVMHLTARHCCELGLPLPSSSHLTPSLRQVPKTVGCTERVEGNVQEGVSSQGAPAHWTHAKNAGPTSPLKYLF